MTDKKLTDNDVIKALECCSSHPREIKCDYCIAFSDGKCKLNTRQILDLINRQKAEIERLEIELKAMRGAANSYKAEIERLTEVCDIPDFVIEMVGENND